MKLILGGGWVRGDTYNILGVKLLIFYHFESGHSGNVVPDEEKLVESSRGLDALTSLPTSTDWDVAIVCILNQLQYDNVLIGVIK